MFIVHTVSVYTVAGSVTSLAWISNTQKGHFFQQLVLAEQLTSSLCLSHSSSGYLLKSSHWSTVDFSSLEHWSYKHFIDFHKWFVADKSCSWFNYLMWNWLMFKREFINQQYYCKNKLVVLNKEWSLSLVPRPPSKRKGGFGHSSNLLLLIPLKARLWSLLLGFSKLEGVMSKAKWFVVRGPQSTVR